MIVGRIDIQMVDVTLTLRGFERMTLWNGSKASCSPEWHGTMRRTRDWRDRGRLRRGDLLKCEGSSETSSFCW